MIDMNKVILIILLAACTYNSFGQGNAVRTLTAKTGSYNLEASDDNDIFSTTEYYDEWGNLKKTFQRSITPQGRNIISQYKYDKFDRLTIAYLPISTSLLSDHEDLFEDARRLTYEDAAYTAIVQENEGDYYYSYSSYENTLTRTPESSTVPGRDFLGKSVEQHQYLNKTQEFKLEIDNQGQISQSLYGIETLHVAEQWDEDDMITRSYTNFLGRAVISEQYGLKTYMVYDILGNVRFVISPEAVRQIVEENGADWSLLNDEAFRDRWFYQNVYDHKRRIIEKKLPGKDWEYIIYDSKNRPTLYQDGNMGSDVVTVYSELEIASYQGKDYDLNGEGASVTLLPGFEFEASENTSFNVGESTDNDGKSTWYVTKYDKRNRPIINGKYYTGYSNSALRNKVKYGTQQSESIIAESSTFDCNYTEIDAWSYSVSKEDITSRNEVSISFESYVEEAFNLTVSFTSNGLYYEVYQGYLQYQQPYWKFFDLTFEVPTALQGDTNVEVTFSFDAASDMKIRYITIEDDGENYEPNPVALSNVHGYTNEVFPQFRNANDIENVMYYGYDNLSLNQNCLDEDAFDDYAFVPAGAVDYDVNYAANLRDVPTGIKTKVTGEDTYLYSANYYNERYELIQSVSGDILGGISRASMTYNWVGTLDKQRLDYTGLEDFSVEYSNVYDDDLRLTSVTQDVLSTNSEPVVINRYEYDELGQLRTEYINEDNIHGVSQQKDYLYNIRGWLSSVNDVDALGTDVFAYNLKYFDNGNGLTEARYNGNVNAMEWNGKGVDQSDQTVKRRNFLYDEHNRLRKSTYVSKVGDSWLPISGNEGYIGELSEVLYDDNGNILNLLRNDFSGNIADDLQYEYNGNQLTNIVDEGHSTPASFGYKGTSSLGALTYHYDRNGNNVVDESKGIVKCTYNDINLPETVLFEDGSSVNYVYSSLGQKLKKITSTSGGLTTEVYYAGPFQYTKVNDEAPKLDFYSFGEGRIRLNDGVVREYDFTDHLGNVRATYLASRSTALEENLTEFTVDTDDNQSYLWSYDIDGYSRVSMSLDYNIITGDGVYVAIKARDDQGNFLSDIIATELRGTAKSGWQHFEFGENIPSNASSITVAIGIGYGGGQTDIDNYSLSVGAFSSVEVIQTQEYMPFGMAYNVSTNSSSAGKNLYQYNGKEYQEETQVYAYEYRHYDPVTGRFGSMDPMAAVFANQSSYAYAGNNPVTYIDYLGLFPGDPNPDCVGNNCDNECSTCNNNDTDDPGGFVTYDYEYGTEYTDKNGNTSRTVQGQGSYIVWEGNPNYDPYGISQSEGSSSFWDDIQPTVDKVTTHLGSATSNFEAYLMGSSKLVNRGTIKGGLRTAQKLTKFAKGTGIAGTVIGSAGAAYNISTGNANAVDLIDVGLLIGSGAAIAVFGTVAAPAVLAVGVVWGITTILYESEINESNETLTGYADGLNDFVNGL